jgi:hypothetical protein
MWLLTITSHLPTEIVNIGADWLGRRGLKSTDATKWKPAILKLDCKFPIANFQLSCSLVILPITARKDNKPAAAAIFYRRVRRGRRENLIYYFSLSALCG